MEAGLFDDLLPAQQQPTGDNAFADLEPGAMLRGEKPVDGGFFAAAKQSGGQLLKGVGQFAADFVPGVSDDNALKRYGQEVIDANPTAVQSLSDIADKPLSAIKEATGNAAGSMAGIVGSRLLGQGITAAAPLTGPAAPVVAAVGQGVSLLGPYAAAALPSFGSIREKQGSDAPEDKAIAALGAGTVGLIENKFGPQEWALSAMTKAGRDQLAEKFTAKTLAGSIAKGVGTGAAVEGGEELVQNPIEQLASYQDPRTPESLADTAFGGVMGAIGGGVVGGPMAGLSHRQPQPVAVPRQDGQGDALIDPATGPLSAAAADHIGRTQTADDLFGDLAPAAPVASTIDAPETANPFADLIPEQTSPLQDFAAQVDPVSLEEAQAMADQSGGALGVAAHPAGGGFLVAPREWLPEEVQPTAPRGWDGFQLGDHVTTKAGTTGTLHFDNTNTIAYVTPDRLANGSANPDNGKVSPRASGVFSVVPGEVSKTIDQAASQANTAPSEAQIAAGNYQKGHIKIGSLDIAIENPVGSTRSGTENGKAWQTTMQAHYGYVKRTEGADGDQVDVYVRPGTPMDYTGPVFVVDQYNPATGQFDEHKAMIGYRFQGQAIKAYDDHFSDGNGAQRRQGVTRMSVEQFAEWARKGDTSQPIKPAAIEDFGEKIGGARKDLALPTGPKPKAPVKVESQEPGWQRRYTPIQNMLRADETWNLFDTKTSKPVRGAEFKSEAAAREAIPLIAVSQRHRVVAVADGFEIMRDVTDRKRVKVVDQIFPTRDAAMAYLAKHAAEIIETKTSFREELFARPEKVMRNGQQRRTGNATAEDFSQTFGFRGVEFGLWNNQDERQEVMNHAFDGLLDLAEVLGVPPKALSLNGDLALAFGARGQGLSGAIAHYERGHAVINLTKMQGAGALAHEWFHALDHYFGRQDGKASSQKIQNKRGDQVFDTAGTGDYASHGLSMESKMREALQTRYKALIQTLFTKAEQYVEDTAKAERFVGSTRDALIKSLTSMRKQLETAPEWQKRNNKPATAEQLAEFDRLADDLVEGRAFQLETRSSEPKKGQRFGNIRLTNDQLDALSALFKTVRGRSGMNAEGTGIVDSLRADLRRYAERVRMLEEARSGNEKTKRVPTQFAMDAKRIDQGSATDYWTTPHEMAARAFSAYVEDKLPGRSDFLSYGSDNALAQYRLFNVRPFPEGAERVAIGLAFDDFIGALQTRETAKGVELFNVAARGAKPTTIDSAIFASARDGGKLSSVLEVVAEASSTPFRRQLARLLIEKRIDAQLQTAPGDGIHGAAFDPKSNRIALMAEADAELHLLHEAVHAATLAGLKSRSLAAAQMKALFAHAKQHLAGKHYGLESVEEFVSEAFTNDQLQQALTKLPARAGSTLRNAWHWFIRNVRGLLGLPDGDENLISQVLDTGVELMTPRAPNGKASNLNPAQWQQVRTPEFKRWFGDWESPTKGAVSQAVDENGEPRVFYHGSRKAAEINAFKPNSRGLIWASSDATTAESYAGNRPGAGVLSVFLNVRNLSEVDLGGRSYVDLPVVDGEDFVDHFAMQAKQSGKDGALLRNVVDDGGDSAVGELTKPADNVAVFRPEQIKSAVENTGAFDPSNPDIRYNRLDSDRLTVSDWLTHQLTNQRSWALGALTRDQLADIYGREMPEVAAFDRVVQQMDQARNIVAEQADALIERWRKLPSKMADVLADVMHLATLEQFDPDLKTRKDVQTPGQSILVKDWGNLSPEAQQIYRDVRDQYRATLVKLRNGLAKRADSQTAAAIRLEFDKYLEEGPYFPLARFGDFVLIANNRIGERIVESFESSAAREKRARGLRAQGWTTKLTAKKAYSAASDGPSGEFVGKVLGLVGGLDIEAKEKAALMDSLNQLAISALPDQSYRKHFSHRKGTPGFSQDAMRAFASSMQHVSHHVARVLHGDELQILVDSLNKRTREAAGDVDTTAMQQVANELSKRLDLMLNPTTHPVTAALGQVGFVMSLGGSVASGITNLSQTPLVTFPWLGARFGFGKAAAALTKASKDYFAGRWDRWSGFVMKDGTGLAADERRALNELEDAGLINLTQAHDLAGTANTDSAASRRSFAINRAMKLVGWTFHVPEVMNRQVSALAAYRLAREKGTHEQAVEAARETLRRTHFDYSASNRARWMAGNFTRVVMMFKQYSQNVTYLLWRQTYQALKGESPEVRREARRMLLGVAATHFAAAGALGLPLGVFGVTPLLGLLAMGMGSEDEPWDWEVDLRNMLADTFGKAGGEAIAHGPLRLLTNVDFASRVGLGDLWIRAPQGDAEGRDLVEKWMLTLLGPVAGYVGNLGMAAKAFDEGKYGRGLEAMLPKMIAAPLKATRYETEGVKSWRGDDLGVTLNGGDVLGTALGFNPSKVAEMYEGRNAIKGREGRLTARREEIANMFVNAALAGDVEMQQEAIKAAQAFSLRNPSVALTAQSLHRSLLAKVKAQALIRDGVYLPAKRQDLLAEGRFANVR